MKTLSLILKAIKNIFGTLVIFLLPIFLGLMFIVSAINSVHNSAFGSFIFGFGLLAIGLIFIVCILRNEYKTVKEEQNI